MNNNKDNRLEYIDMIKGFGILLVILGHAYSVNGIRIWIHSFHMPLFFIISGCLFYHTESIKKSMHKLFKSRIKSLLIPYIVFNTIFILINYVLSAFSFTSLINDINIIIRLNGLVALWFLPALLISELGFAIISKILKNDKLIIFLISFVFIASILWGKSYLKYIVLLRSFVGIGFFAIGYYSFKYIKKLELSWSVIILAIIINIVLSKINGFVDLFQLEFNNALLYIYCSLLGTFSILMLFKKIENINLLIDFGRNSLIILCTHQCIMSFIRVIFRNDLTGMISGFIMFLIVILIEIPVIEIINRYLPFIIGKKYDSCKNVKIVNMQKDYID